MKWPDWFGWRAKAELHKLRQTYKDAINALESSGDSYDRLHESNLRLISALREMDQGTFQISQVAPDWARIQPIFKKMFEATEKRMATENNRIKNLVVGEIVGAYNEPPKTSHNNSGNRMSRPAGITSGRKQIT